MLHMTAISKRFPGVIALDRVDFDVSAGEIAALVGENGAGKSTLMKLLSGVFPPDEGEIRLGGSPFRPSSPGEAREAGVSMVHQELALAPHLEVAENLFLGMESSRFGVLRRSEMRERAREALLGGPRDAAAKPRRTSLR